MTNNSIDAEYIAARLEESLVFLETAFEGLILYQKRTGEKIRNTQIIERFLNSQDRTVMVEAIKNTRKGSRAFQKAEA